MTAIRRAPAALVFMLFLSLAKPPASLAADADVESLKAQVQALVERVAAQEQELRDLKAEQARLALELDKKSRVSEVQEPASPSQSAPRGIQPESAAQSASLAGGKDWFADHLRVGGYGSVRFETNDAPRGAGACFTFRRFVLTTDAKITDRLRVYSETEFERLWCIEVEKSATATAGGLEAKQEVDGNSGGELALEQAWGQYNFAENHGVRAGVVLPPLGRFNILHDDDYWDIPRRTLVDRDGPVTPLKSAWRELGAGLVGAFNIGQSGRLDYQAYVVNGATIDFNLESVAQTRFPRRSKLELEGEFGLFSGPFDGSQSARAFTWRTAYSPALAGEFALSGYHGRYTPDYLGARERVNSLGFDYKWRRGAFEFEGEAIYTSFGRLGRVLDSFAAAVYRSAAATTSEETDQLESEIEFDLANLARTRYGFWTDFKYHWRPAWLKRSFLGRPFEDPRLIPILRYERAWLNRNVEQMTFDAGRITTLATDNLEQDRVSLGLSFRPVSSFGILDRKSVV